MHSSSAIPSALPVSQAPSIARREGDEPLASVAIGTTARIVALEMEGDFGEWLRAVGIHEGEEVIVLRRGLFGGPLHVRTGAGGEFALNRGLARSIRVART